MFGGLSAATPTQILCLWVCGKLYLHKSCVWGFVWSCTWANPVFGDEIEQPQVGYSEMTHADWTGGCPAD